MTINWQAVEQESLGYFRALLRINTTNPPGNETAAAQYLADILSREGIPAQVVESAPGRGSVLGRLEGPAGEKPLLFLSHLDVVPTEPQAWQHNPFGGELVDGYVWGRGAVDTKQLTIQELMVLLLLKREGIRLKKGITLAATADEEMGGDWGVKWLLENRPELLDCDYSINEGGGFGLKINERSVYLVQTAEKGVCWFRIRVKGKPGHASIPKGENAVVDLAAVIGRAGTARLPQHNTATVREMIGGLSHVLRFPASWLLRGMLVPWLSPLLVRLLPSQGVLGPILWAITHNTASPTILRAGEKTNVIPSTAEAQIDGRVLPGQDFQSLLTELRPYLGDKAEVEPIKTSEGTEVDYRTDLYRLFGQALAEHDPGSVAIPFMVPGGTDGRFLVAQGKRIYGFSPMKQEPGISVLELAHAHNERLSVQNLMFGMRVLYDVVRRFCAG